MNQLASCWPGSPITWSSSKGAAPPTRTKWKCWPITMLMGDTWPPLPRNGETIPSTTWCSLSKCNFFLGSIARQHLQSCCAAWPEHYDPGRHVPDCNHHCLCSGWGQSQWHRGRWRRGPCITEPEIHKVCHQEQKAIFCSTACQTIPVWTRIWEQFQLEQEVLLLLQDPKSHARTMPQKNPWK